MAVNLILIIIGLIICFGGIYFRRLFSGIIGFVWGALLTIGLILITVGTRKFDLQEYIVPVLVAGIILGIASAVYYRICALVNGFITGAFIAFVVAALANDFEATAGVIIIALILGVITALLSFKFYDYSFILMTAFLGGIIASLGTYGLITGSDIDKIAFTLFWSGDEGFAIVALLTLVLTVTGFVVQLKRLNAILASAAQANNKELGSNFRYNGPSSLQRLLGKIINFVGNIVVYVTASISDAISGFTSKEARRNLRKEIQNEGGLIFAPVFSFLVVPLLYLFLNNSYYSTIWYSIASWLNTISLGLTLAVIVYYVLCKSKSFTLAIVFFSAVSYLVFNHSSIIYLCRQHGFWYISLIALRFLLYWIIISIVSKIAKKKNIQVVIMNIVLFSLNEWFVDLITNSIRGLRITRFTIVQIILQFVVAFFIYKRRISCPRSDNSTCGLEQFPSQPSAQKQRVDRIAIFSIAVIIISAYALEPHLIKIDTRRAQKPETYEETYISTPEQNSSEVQTKTEDEPSFTESGDVPSAIVIDDNNTPDAMPKTSSLKDGKYNVILYRGQYEQLGYGTYATVDIEEFVRYSDMYVESLRVGSNIEGTIIETLDYFEGDYYKEYWINGGFYRIYKSSSSSEWMLLWPSDIPVSRVVKSVSLLFPNTASYYDEMISFDEMGDYETVQLSRIEDHFEYDRWSNSVTVTVTVQSGTIVEGYIYYTP